MHRLQSGQKVNFLVDRNIYSLSIVSFTDSRLVGNLEEVGAGLAFVYEIKTCTLQPQQPKPYKPLASPLTANCYVD